MRTPSPENPPPKDPIELLREQTRQRIERYGFTTLIIGAGACDVPGCDCEPDPFPYAYTLGMHAHASPDFVTFGLPLSHVAAVVDPVCERAMRGRPVPIGREYRQWIGGGVIVSLVPVPDLWVEHDPGRVGAWFDLFDPAFPSFVQIFWADEAGRMPWEPACNPAVAAMQPMLFEDPTSVPPVW